MKRQVPVTLVVGLALLMVAATAYIALVRPAQAESAQLESEAAELDTRLAQLLHPQDGAAQGPQIAVADLFRLAKAMPDTDDMAGILLELDAVARSAGIEFRSIQPQVPVAGAGYYSLPIALVFEGDYYDLADFLFRLRGLVTVNDGELEADGRLYTLDALDLHESTEKGFPRVEAALTISAYGFGDAPVSPTSPPAETTDTTTTETAETTTEPTTTAPAEDESAALGGTP
jgi:Tfp pilus assembly protein PilO